MYILGREESIVGKGEKDDYEHFLLFPQSFQKPSCPRLLKKLGLCGKELK